MLIAFEDRASDSPFVDRVWRSHSERAGTFCSMATCNWVMVVTRHEGRAFLTVRGPETKATTAECPAEGEWVGIHFKIGSFMPLLPNGCIRDRSDINLPAVSRRSFLLNGSVWEYPGFDNADVFVNRLVKKGLVVRDAGIDVALRGGSGALSRRTEQRHFLRTTGMTRATIRQIERARYATRLLRNGTSILQVVHDAGYFDQAHLTRSLKHFIGQTPAQLLRGSEQLSFLYNTGEP
jgi:Helix-turn-helix domain